MSYVQGERPGLWAELMETISALWFDVDHRDGRSVSAFFLPDAELRFSARSFHGAAEIDAVYAARAGRGPRVSRHIATNLHITAADADRASVVSTLILFAEDGASPRSAMTPAMVGDVVDEFQRHGDRWLIKSRHIQHMFIAPGTALAVPTE